MPIKTGGEAIVRDPSLPTTSTPSSACPASRTTGSTTPLFDNRDQIRVIHTRHEEGAAYMAFGAAAATGQPAVFSVVPGPGLAQRRRRPGQRLRR